jgi:Zn-dependent peptidase ImmA (M78 family)/DNA-binding XRE family transcriptional regulator
MTLYERIGSRIRQAREAIGYSQEELGRQLGYSAAAISYFETGVRKIKIDDLHRIARALGKPIDFFLQEEPEDEIVALRWRAQQELTPEAYRQVEVFLNHLDAQGIRSQLEIDLSGFRPYAAAYQLLEIQDIKEPPVPVEEVAQGVGIPVREWHFPNEISALLVQSRQLVAIGVNQQHGEARKRFSIAHELGHAVLGHMEKLYIEFTAPELLPKHGPEREKDEREANWFAADLLMPIDWIREDWKRYKGNLHEMADHYGVSEQALWIRLQQFNLTQGVITS